MKAFSPIAAVALFLMGLPHLEAGSVELDYRAGSQSLTNVPGIKITMPPATETDQTGWKLASFTWLTARGTGATPTGFGRLWVFEASEFDPAGKKSRNFKSSDPGFVAQSLVFDAEAGGYVFPEGFVLKAGQDYYFLNEGVVSTAYGAVANYGANPTQVVEGRERWSANNGGAPWSRVEGTPNFLATLSPASGPPR